MKRAHLLGRVYDAAFTMIVPLILFWFLLGSVAASTCSTDSPFAPEIVGRYHHQFLPCYPTRWTTSTYVKVNATHIHYVPYRVDYNYGQFCQKYYVFRLNRWAPMITMYPFLSMPSTNGFEVCGVEQERQKMVAWPQGSTRDQFIAGLNETITGLAKMRDMKCRTNAFGVHEEEGLFSSGFGVAHMREACDNRQEMGSISQIMQNLLHSAESQSLSPAHDWD
ncbi:unnamed protein product [Agarophyton chilense]